MAEKAAAAADDDDNDEGSSSDDDEGVITEIRFVPGDKAACEWPRCNALLAYVTESGPECSLCVSLSVESMFSAMCECQALHPDPEDEDSDNDFEGEEYDVEEAGKQEKWTHKLN